MSDLFTADDIWNGGYYELAIELGLRSDKRLQTALEAIWCHESVDGCYADKNLEPAHQPRMLPTLETQLVGVATLPGGQCAACGTFIVREDNGPDWIGFYLPMGALETVYDVGAYPFDDDQSSRSWREPGVNPLDETFG